LPADDLGARKRELTTEEIKRILKEAASLGCLSVRFSGGEPLLREDFEEIYIFARRQGLKVVIFTNATLVDEHLAKLFADIPPLEKIEVTLYGMRKETYEAATRAPGSFQAAWRGINLLLDKGVAFVVKGAWLASNRHERDEFEKWAATIPSMDGPPAYSMFFDLHCRRDDRKNALIKKLRPTPAEGLAVLVRDKDRYAKEMKEFCSRFMRPPGDRLFPCGAGLQRGCVDAYGGLQPCTLLRHQNAVYDLKNGSLRDAFENFFPKMRQRKATNPAYIDRCAKCFLKGLCEQCPGKSWIEHGALDTPVEYLCEIAHGRARLLGLIGEGEKGWEVKNWMERIKKFCEEEEARCGDKN
jgi:radical SAM protein with 4Fe4S-binding SPASM domain